MQIILKENVHGLGFANDIVTVKDGYGRNYLIPSGKAVIASESAKKQLAEQLKQQAKKLEKLQQEAQSLGERIAAVNDIVIAAKVSATGSIYGSVNNHHIAEELAKRGIEVDRKAIVLKDVKELGQYVAVVKLHKEVAVEVNFTVVAENEPAKVEAPVVEETVVEEAPVVEEVVEETVEEEAPAVEETPAEETEE